MNELISRLKKYNFKINGIKYLKNIIILNTNKGKFVYKNKNNFKIYEYLKSKGFRNFPKLLNNINDDYELREYIDNIDNIKDIKVNDLASIVSFLHKKTFFYKEIDLDKLKNRYEFIQIEADYLMNYYSDLNNLIDNTTFMSPFEYLLVSNINLFYNLIYFVKQESTNWYNYIKENKNIRYVLSHNNISTDHLLVNDYSYLISWDKADFNYPYIDIKKLLEDNYQNLDIQVFLDNYLKDNDLNKFEFLEILIYLALPKRIERSNNTYLDCFNLSNYLEYLRKIVFIIQKNNKNINNI